MHSSGKQQHIKIADIVPVKFEDFLTYCSIAGKMFSDEITPVDYVAYRSQFGRDKSEVKHIRALIEGCEVLDKPSNTAEETALLPVTDTDVSILDDESSAENQNPDDEAELVDEIINEIVTEHPAEVPKGDDIAENSECTYAEILGLNADTYTNISVEPDLYEQYSAALSIRSLNALRNAKCVSLKDLLLLTPSHLSKIKNIGAKSVKEIEIALLDISKEMPPSGKQVLPKVGSSIRKKVLCPIIESMLCGEPYSVDELTENEKGFFAEAFEAAELLGSDFCIELMVSEEHQYTKAVIKMLSDFNYKTMFSQGIVGSAKAAVSTWKPEFLSKWLLPYLQLFCISQKKNVSDEFESLLKRDVTVGRYAELVATVIDSDTENLADFAKDLEAFQTWMSGIDLDSLCKKAFDQNEQKNERMFDVLIARATGRTLEEIAQQYGLTRERVRQIEKKDFTSFKIG